MAYSLGRMAKFFLGVLGGAVEMCESLFYKYFIPYLKYFYCILVIMVFFKLLFIVTHVFMLNNCRINDSTDEYNKAHIKVQTWSYTPFPY